MKKTVLAAAVAVMAAQSGYAGFKIDPGAAQPQPVVVPMGAPALAAPVRTNALPLPAAESPVRIKALEAEVNQLRAQVRTLEQEAQALRTRAAQVRAAEAAPVAMVDAIVSPAEPAAGHVVPDGASAAGRTFLFTSGGVRVEAGSQLDPKLVARAKKARTIEISGYTDNTGSSAANARIARMRAQAVKLYLIGQGVRADKIKVIGRAGVYVADNDSATGRAANRRAVISLG